MKTLQKILISFIFIIPIILSAQNNVDNYHPTLENIKSRQTFESDRFGIFIHWGIYSLFGQGEWYLHNANILSSEYEKGSNAFYPHDFDAKKWVKIIKNSGAKYITFTTRHHDGFSMWNTKESDYNIMNTPYKKDILKLLSKECHRQKIHLHLYYSHLDWSRIDYPLGRTGLKSRIDKNLKENYTSYLTFMKHQLKELLTCYGKIRAIWFDGYWDHDSTFNWKLKEQYNFIHQLQPSCLIANNHHRTPFLGEDIQIFERDVPGENNEGLSGQTISELPLETCQTMNGMWGYKIIDQNYKTALDLVHLLSKTASKGANLLLNIGPQPDGNLPTRAIEKLDSIGIWMRTNGNSIYKTSAGIQDLENNYVTTTTPQNIYIHLLKNHLEHISIPINKSPKSVFINSTKEKLQTSFINNSLIIKLPKISYLNNVIVLNFY